MTDAPSTPLQPWTFDELVREGRALIPVHAPAWTDHNPSDPGITLIELLAYVTEVLVYRLSRVTPQARLQFLRLLKGADWQDWKALDGAPAAVIDQALDLAVRQLGQCECAITASDFERLAVEAARAELGPDSRVGALCMAGVDLAQDLRGARSRDTRAHVTVVVMPAQELASDAIDRLCAHVRAALAPCCLLTTRLRIVGPVPLHIAFGARIALRPGADRGRTFAAVENDLRRISRPPGSPIRLTDVTAAIDSAEGVDFVEDVFVRAIAARADALADEASRVGVQVGVLSTPGIDARLGVAGGSVGTTRLERLKRDDAGRLSAVAVQPWEMPHLHLAPEAVRWIGAEPEGTPPETRDAR